VTRVGHAGTVNAASAASDGRAAAAGRRPAAGKRVGDLARVPARPDPEAVDAAAPLLIATLSTIMSRYDSH
jgi:hypothetical protein